MATVREVMSRDPVCCTADEGVVECARRMDGAEVGMVPVVESLDTRKLVGVVTDRDLCMEVVAASRDPADCTVEECMTDELITVGPDDEVEDAEELMRRNRLRRLPVVDADGVCVGVVSRGDLAEGPTQRPSGEVTRPT